MATDRVLDLAIFALGLVAALALILVGALKLAVGHADGGPSIRHRLAHLFGACTGRVETFWALFRHGDDKRLMVGFRCGVCHELSGVHEVSESIVYPERQR